MFIQIHQTETAVMDYRLHGLLWTFFGTFEQNTSDWCTADTDMSNMNDRGNETFSWWFLLRIYMMMLWWCLALTDQLGRFFYICNNRTWILMLFIIIKLFWCSVIFRIREQNECSIQWFERCRFNSTAHYRRVNYYGIISYKLFNIITIAKHTYLYF